MADKVFVNGLIVKKKETQYWDILNVSVKIDDFKEFMDTYWKWEWLNLAIKNAKNGWVYCELNDWQPGQTKSKPKEEVRKVDEISVEDIPF